MIFNGILTLLKSNVNYLQLLHNKHFITAIKNIRFEIYFRISSIQTCRMFYFSRRLFVKHYTFKFLVSDFQ